MPLTGGDRKREGPILASWWPLAVFPAVIAHDYFRQFGTDGGVVTLIRRKLLDRNQVSNVRLASYE